MRKKLFISYSHKDARWLDRVREHLEVLEREGLIDQFDDTCIAAGEDWYGRLDREMLDARIAVLLVSAAFLTSAFIRKEEIPRLFKQHQANGLVIYPLLVRDCVWQEVSWLAPLQMRPRGTQPIASMRGPVLDKCLADVAREVASIVKANAGATKKPASQDSSNPRRALDKARNAEPQWSAKLLKRETRLRVIQVNLAEASHVIEYRVPIIDLLNPFTVKVDDAIVFYDKGNSPNGFSFQLVDGPKKLMAKIETDIKGLNAISKFRLRVKNQILYSDGY